MEGIELIAADAEDVPNVVNDADVCNVSIVTDVADCN
jgi:hypothetical protein